MIFIIDKFATNVYIKLHKIIKAKENVQEIYLNTINIYV